MKKILMSTQPEWVEKILTREKTIEIRKTRPKCELPCKVYIYQTKKNFIFKVLKWLGLCKGKVVAEFMLNKITDLQKLERIKRVGLIMYFGCMNMGQYEKYNGRYAWRIDSLKIYDKPKELSEFGLKRAFQSWGYVEEL